MVENSDGRYFNNNKDAPKGREIGWKISAIKLEHVTIWMLGAAIHADGNIIAIAVVGDLSHQKLMMQNRVQGVGTWRVVSQL